MSFQTPFFQSTSIITGSIAVPTLDSGLSLVAPSGIGGPTNLRVNTDNRTIQVNPSTNQLEVISTGTISIGEWRALLLRIREIEAELCSLRRSRCQCNRNRC